jgi:hypothetical protein
VSHRTIRVRLASNSATDRSYDVLVGPGVLTSIGTVLRSAGAQRCVVIADAAVSGSHAARAVSALETAGLDIAMLVVPAGEASKCVAEAGRLWSELARLAVDPAVHGWTGVYVSGRAAIRSSEVSYDRDLQADLWALSADLTGLGVTEAEFAWKAVSPGPPVRHGPEPEAFTTLRLQA